MIQNSVTTLKFLTLQKLEADDRSRLLETKFEAVTN